MRRLPDSMLDTTTPEDRANGIRRHVVFYGDGTVGEDVVMSSPDRPFRDVRTNYEHNFPERR